MNKVYGNLMACNTICSIGIFVNAYTPLSGLFWQLLNILILLFLTFKVTNVKEDMKTRIACHWYLCFVIGYLVSSLTPETFIESSYLIKCELRIAVMFACFTCITFYSNKRYQLYIGGLLSSFSIVELYGTIYFLCSPSFWEFLGLI